MRKIALISLLGMTLAVPCSSVAAEADWTAVDKALGKTAAVQGDVHRYGIPRSDLKVKVDGVTIKPALALGGWVAFEPAKDGTMLMGDIVLTENEVTPVMTNLLQSGIEITALHNHLMRSTPATFYMHIRGHGDPAKLAGLVRQALAETKTPFEPSSTASSQAAKLDLDTDQLDQSLGAQEKINGGVYQFSIPRKETATENGMPAPAAMGTGTAIKAAIAGDFVVTAEELNPMISALRENGIEVVAIHSHMLEEQPRLFFVHFWANDDAAKLAKGLRAALDKMAVARS